MELKEGFITHETGGEQIMVSVGKTEFSGIVKSNETAAFIVDCLKTEIAEKIRQKYDVTKETVTADVKKVIDKLRSIGAIDE